MLTFFAVLGNLTLNSSQVASISSNLQSRWGKYGAPAPECASTPATISPFAGSFELQAHLVAGNTVAALDLMRLQWGDFMLDDPRMTNSTFIEGYSADGSLHYSPYYNDPRSVLHHKRCLLARPEVAADADYVLKESPSPTAGPLAPRISSVATSQGFRS